MLSRCYAKVTLVFCLSVLVGFGCTSKPKVDKDVSVEVTPVVEPNTGEIPVPPRSETPTTAMDVKLENVLFSYDSFQVTDSELVKIQAAAELMKAKPDIKLTTEGNCDERGSAEYNMSLGEHRALAVRAALVALGIDASRIQTKSYGREKPIDNRHCEEAWQKNRRVEFSLYAEKVQ
jgi:peptidoglycan-associated lipoprotein